MDTLSRRKFFGRALLAGAGAVLTYPITQSDLGRAQTVDSSGGSSDIDPGFVAGQVVDVQGGGLLAIQDLDSRIHYARLTPISRTWKAARWNADPLAGGDCVYVRGELDRDGVLEVDRLWANIGTITGTISGRMAAEFMVELEDRSEHLFRVNERTEVQTPSGIFVPRDTASLRVGDSVQVIGFVDPATGDLTASRIWGFGVSTAESLAADDPDIIAQTATSVTVGGLTSFFCCGPQGSFNYCGKLCECTRLQGCGGACGGCRGDRLHMAWPKIGTGCIPQCPNPDCCVSDIFPRQSCGASVSILNPCNQRTVNVIIQDCGPVPIHCRPPMFCENRIRVKFDLTPCAFSAIANLDSGLATAHCTVTL